MQTKFAGILLAAGYSRRFGTDKLRVPLADGTPIVVAAARILRDGMQQACGNEALVLAVVRPEQEELATLLKREGLQVLIAPQARQGMGASLAAGVAASAEAAGWLIALGDMPFLKPETVGSVARALAAGAPLVAPVIGGRRGHPVGFANTFGTALSTLGGDAGARELLAAHPVTLLPCDDAGALRDIDTPGDLEPCA